MTNFFQRNRVFLLHLSFWCFYVSFYAYAISSRPGREITLLRFSLSVIMQLSFAMLVTYGNYFILLPRYLKHQNAWKYFFEFIIPFALLITGRVFLQRFIMESFDIHERYYYTTFYVVQLTFDTILITIFVGMLRFATGWFELEAKRKQMENDKLANELKFLKAQINPHFLFNTLNNLYYLAYSHSPNTTEVIAKLSQMMRYMIYDSNYPQVLLTKEIEYMQNYISLERLRLNNEVPIEFKVEGSVENTLITPLIFITFLENAFKHGVSANTVDSWVKINIRMDHNECLYQVENSKLIMGEQKEKSGIGLQNLNRRLELSYPGRFTLKTDDQMDRYIAQLKITL
ncbi:MAG TPA: sensor histidine kinase [Cytophagales bacterium]|nr:sensor histidine kinase [Cytophagales bacterium]